MRPLEDLISSGLVWTAAPSRAGNLLLEKLAAFPREIYTGQHSAWGVRFGVREIDDAFVGDPVRGGEIHEWGLPPQEGAKDKSLLPPHSLLTLLMKQALSVQQNKNRRHIFWIGRSVWPTPHILQQILGREALQHCLFLDPPDANQILWTAVEALRSTATLVVIAPLLRLPMATSKKLALAAQAGGSLGFILRPRRDLATCSAATGRWEVAPAPSTAGQVTWDLNLRHYKGRQPTTRRWRIEFLHEVAYAKVSLRVSPALDSESLGTRVSTPTQRTA